LISEDFFELLRQLYLFVVLNPVLVLELSPFSTCPSVETPLEIIYFDNLTGLFCFYFPKNVFHADEVYSIDFLFILIDFQFVKAKYSDDQSVRVFGHMLVVVLDNFS
jgi:hypothetical protein